MRKKVENIELKKYKNRELANEIERRIRSGELMIGTFTPEDDYYAPCLLRTDKVFVDLNRLLDGRNKNRSA
jgi:hypothetical protein